MGSSNHTHRSHHELNELRYNKDVMKILIVITLMGLIAPLANAGEYTKVGQAPCGCGQYSQKVIVGYTHCRKPIYHVRYVPMKHSCRNYYHAQYPKTYNRYNTYQRSCRSSHYRPTHYRSHGHHSGININYRSKHWNVNYHHGH
jgi:hypothetical protein